MWKMTDSVTRLSSARVSNSKLIPTTKRMDIVVDMGRDVEARCDHSRSRKQCVGSWPTLSLIIYCVVCNGKSKFQKAAYSQCVKINQVQPSQLLTRLFIVNRDLILLNRNKHPAISKNPLATSYEVQEQMFHWNVRLNAVCSSLCSWVLKNYLNCGGPFIS